MGYGSRKLDMSHTLPADAGFGHFHSASVTDNAFISYLFIFPAMTFPVLARPENSFTVQAVLLGLQRSVIDGFGFGNLTP